MREGEMSVDEAPQRVALVTGGARGIGAAITRRLLDDGHCVAVTYNQNRRIAERFIEPLAAEGRSITLHQVNVANPGDCVRLAHEVLDRHGRVDYLINNAGVNRDRTTLRLSSLGWEEVIRTDLSGAFYLSQALLEHMLQRGSGRIVNMSSIVGQLPNVGQVNYAAAKAGLFGMTRVLALETADKGITVNCVAPGAIETEMMTNLPPDIVQTIVERIPAKRMGTPAEVAHVVSFLLDDRSGYITGAVLNVNGGFFMA
jgi:NAD(P)-dependent dehydrogenase (short-subunit alcohol dehydrogenase family)